MNLLCGLRVTLLWAPTGCGWERDVNYRRDIDGMRALAVLPVLLTHAQVPWLTGGFVGVDVFFVISGFLITGILEREIENGRYSITSFYERRARRILPALFAMLAACILAAAAFLPPAEYEALGFATLATLGFVSNIWFASQPGGYFGMQSEFQPLLHTWSLAVEEQFYIVFPVLLWLTRRWTLRRRVILIIALTALSFAASVKAMAHHGQINFYLSPFRAWELGAGAILALVTGGRTAPPRWSSVAGIAGLVLILGSMRLLDAQSAFPGLTAAPACIGAVLLLWSGPASVTGRLLSLSPVVAVGLISYSLYLWHWPVLVAARWITQREYLSGPDTLVCLTLAFLLAALSWRYVERPFRRGQSAGGIGLAKLVAAALGGGAAIAGLAVLTIGTGGLPWRVPASTRDIYAEAMASKKGYSSYFSNGLRDPLLPIGSDGTKPVVLLWGDSHAAALVQALGEWMEARGSSGLSATRGGCLPLLAVTHIDKEGDALCAEFADSVIRELEKHPTVRTVILHGRWNLGVTGVPAEGELGPPYRLVPSPKFAGDLTEGSARDLVERAIRTTIEKLEAAGMRVVVVADVPEPAYDPAYAFYERSLLNLTSVAPPTAEAYAQRNSAALTLFRELQDKTSLDLLVPGDFLCASVCVVEKNGHILYHDDDHLSLEGARLLVPLLMDAIGPLPEPS